MFYWTIINIYCSIAVIVISYLEILYLSERTACDLWPLSCRSESCHSRVLLDVRHQISPCEAARCHSLQPICSQGEELLSDEQRSETKISFHRGCIDSTPILSTLNVCVNTPHPKSPDACKLEAVLQRNTNNHMTTRLASLLTPHAQSVWPQPTECSQHRGSLAVSFELSLWTRNKTTEKSWQTQRIQTRVNDLELNASLWRRDHNKHAWASLNSSFKQFKSNFLALTAPSVWHTKKSLCVFIFTNLQAELFSSHALIIIIMHESAGVSVCLWAFDVRGSSRSTKTKVSSLLSWGVAAREHFITFY